MSTAHRPNFDAAKGRESKAHLSQQTSKFDLAAHTTLKFRGGGDQPAAKRRDLKHELEVAEWKAKNKRRITAGLLPLPPPPGVSVHQKEKEEEEEEDEETKRRKEAIAKAIELDRESHSHSESESESDDEDEVNDKEEEVQPHNLDNVLPPPATNQTNPSDAYTSSSTSDSDSDSDSDTDSDEDEQALLQRELAKIRAERHAEKQRQSTTSHLTHQQQIATANPLLNLQSLLHPTSPTTNNGVPPDQTGLHFGVNKRWDHDVIFKNQAAPATKHSSPGFVNDLTRSEFHKKFINRYIK